MHIARIACLLCCLASATSHAKGIVLESYTTAKPDDADRILSPVLDELAGRGFESGDSVGRRFESVASQPSVRAPGLPEDFAARVEEGHKAFIAGKFEQTVRTLGPLVETALANPAVFAQNSALRERLLKALIALGLARHRLGDGAAARATFAELLRSFPDTILSRGSYGPEAVTAFEQVRREISTVGRGRMIVKATSDTAVVYLDEQFGNVGGLAKGDLLPGEYRVFTQVGKQVSRVHRIAIRAHTESTLTIDLGFDRTVATSGWTGLVFETAAAREKLEAPYAVAFAKAVNATELILVGIDRVRGRPAVVGAVISVATGRELRRASLALEPDPPADRLRALGRFLAGEDPVGLDVQLAGEVRPKNVGATPPKADRGAATATSWRYLKYGTGVLALSAFAIGGYYLSIDGSCRVPPAGPGLPCRELENTRTQAFVGLGAGAALAGITVFLFVRDIRANSNTSTAFLVPTGGGAIAGATVRF